MTQEVREFCALTASLSLFGEASAAVIDMFRPGLAIEWRAWTTDPAPPVYPGDAPPCPFEAVPRTTADPEPEGDVDYDAAAEIVDTVRALNLDIAGVSANEVTIGLITEEAIRQWMEDTPERRERIGLPAEVHPPTWRWAAWSAGARNRAEDDTYDRQAAANHATRTAWCARPDVIAWRAAMDRYNYASRPEQIRARWLANGEAIHKKPFAQWLTDWIAAHRNDSAALFWAAYHVVKHNLTPDPIP